MKRTLFVPLLMLGTSLAAFAQSDPNIKDLFPVGCDFRGSRWSYSDPEVKVETALFLRDSNVVQVNTLPFKMVRVNIPFLEKTFSFQRSDGSKSIAEFPLTTFEPLAAAKLEDWIHFAGSQWTAKIDETIGFRSYDSTVFLFVKKPVPGATSALVLWPGVRDPWGGYELTLGCGSKQ